MRAIRNILVDQETPRDIFSTDARWCIERGQSPLMETRSPTPTLAGRNPALGVWNPYKAYCGCNKTTGNVPNVHCSCSNACGDERFLRGNLLAVRRFRGDFEEILERLINFMRRGVGVNRSNSRDCMVRYGVRMLIEGEC